MEGTLTLIADPGFSITPASPPPDAPTPTFGVLAAVPEPLTILGTGTAIGFGAFFKRQTSKKQKEKAEV